MAKKTYTIELDDSDVAALKKLAACRGLSDIQEDEDFNPYDWYGGNMDDAFNGGATMAEVDAARELLTLIGEL